MNSTSFMRIVRTHQRRRFNLGPATQPSSISFADFLLSPLSATIRSAARLALVCALSARFPHTQTAWTCHCSMSHAMQFECQKSLARFLCVCYPFDIVDHKMNWIFHPFLAHILEVFWLASLAKARTGLCMLPAKMVNFGNHASWFATSLRTHKRAACKIHTRGKRAYTGCQTHQVTVGSCARSQPKPLRRAGFLKSLFL